VVGVDALAAASTPRAYPGIIDESRNRPMGVGPAAHAKPGMRRAADLCSLDLDARFAADHRLQLAHHGRIGCGPATVPSTLVRGFHVGHPVAHGFVHCVFQVAVPFFDEWTLAPSNRMRTR